MKIIFVFLITILASGCAIRKNVSTPFSDPQNTPPVDDGGSATDPGKGTKFCAPDATGKFDGAAIVSNSGQNPDGSAWTEGGACVLRPIREVWAVLNNQPVMKFKDADRLTFTRTPNPKPTFTHLYEVKYYKSTIIGPIDWTIQWYHGFDRGSFSAPQRVNISYQKVRGTSNISLWHGGIVLTKVTDTVTSIGIRNDLKTRQSSSANAVNCRNAVSEIIGDVRTGAADFDSLDTGITEQDF